MSVIEMFFEIPSKLRNLAATLSTWLTSSITIFGNEVSIWGLLGGSAVAIIGVIIVISIING